MMRTLATVGLTVRPARLSNCEPMSSSSARICWATVADEFSHECVSISVDCGVSSQYVTRLLDQIAFFRDYPLAVCTDNGPESTSRAFMGWVRTQGKHCAPVGFDSWTIASATTT